MVDINSTTETEGSEVDNLLQKVEFGAQLRQAREKAGLSVSDVAVKLLISEDIIRAIDNSQSDVLPAATFTQGYIRSYARILNLNADSIINEYNQVVPEAKQVLTPHSVLPSRKTSVAQLLLRFLMIVLVVGVAAVFFWIYDGGYQLPNLPSVQLEQDPQALSPEQDVADEIQLDEMENLQQPDDISDSYAAPDTQLIIEQGEQPVLSGEAIQEPVANTVSTIPAQPETAVTGKLVITALDDSWCEITDANAERLVYRLLDSGEEISLQGELPFRIFLGNARQVRLELNNTIIAFDHLIRSRSNTVNLQLMSEDSVELYKAR